MTTKKTRNFKDADLAKLIEEYDKSKNKYEVLSESDLYTQPKERIPNSQPTEPIETSKPVKSPDSFAEKEPAVIRRVSQKQRKASLEEYRNTFLLPPKIIDRKTVYLSGEIRDRLDEIVRRLGERGSSVSGFIENMAKEHLEAYQEEIDQWKRL